MLEKYRAKVELSELFDVKNAYYRFWDDIKHLINVGWYDETHFRYYAGKLHKEMLEKILQG